MEVRSCGDVGSAAADRKHEDGDQNQRDDYVFKHG
jgi:hypothetical protein